MKTAWREIAVGVCVAAAAGSLYAAVDVRDRTAANTAEIRRTVDVQAEKNDRILSDLSAIKKHLGILP